MFHLYYHPLCFENIFKVIDCNVLYCNCRLCRFIMTQDLKKTRLVDNSAKVFQFDKVPESDPDFHSDFKAIAVCCYSG